jgi:hypothetical protein
MKKILPILIVGTLVLKGLGAVAVKIETISHHENLNDKFIEMDYRNPSILSYT